MTASANEPANILWSSGAVSTTVTATASGVYKATFTNQNGCTFTTPSVAIDVVGTPNATVEAVVYNENGQVGAVYQTNFTACEGDDVNLQVNGLPGYTYQWPNGSTGTEISFSENTNNGLIRGDYVFTVTVTDGTTGCSSLASINVEVSPVPAVQIASNPAGIICENTPVTLSVTFPQPDVNTLGRRANQVTVSAPLVRVITMPLRSMTLGVYGPVATRSNPKCTREKHCTLGCLTRCLPTKEITSALPRGDQLPMVP
ncbi:MAG: hypothetical protein R2825_09430 [Saprospiraceae bacterium]